MDQKQKISTLWIVVVFNIVVADILTFITPGSLQEMMTGTVGGVSISPILLLVFAMLLEIPILMIYLSRTLAPTANRVANTVAVVITILFVVGGGSLTPHYIFFATVEVLCMLWVARLVWSK